MAELRVAQGDVVVREGDEGDHVFFIASGLAEVTVSGQWGPKLVSVLQARNSFGAIALFASDGKRAATVTAQSDLLLFSLDGARFRRLIEGEHAAADALRSCVTELLTTNLLSRVGPLVRLDADARRQLAASVRPRTAQAGAVIVREGEVGESCFVIRGEVPESHVRTKRRDERHRSSWPWRNLWRGGAFDSQSKKRNRSRSRDLRASRTGSGRTVRSAGAKGVGVRLRLPHAASRASPSSAGCSGLRPRGRCRGENLDSQGPCTPALLSPVGSGPLRVGSSRRKGYRA